MRNLVVLGERRRCVQSFLEDQKSSTTVDICNALDDEGLESFTVVLTNNGMVAKVAENGTTGWTCDLNKITETNSNQWFEISYVDPMVVCISKSGEIVTVSPSTGEGELVGVFDYGLQAAAWSPDGETLLLVTSSALNEEEEDIDEANNETTPSDTKKETKSVLLTMNSQWEVLAEVTIEKFMPSTNSDDDSNNNTDIAVAWKPDGTLFGVNAVDEEDNTRKIRIYKRDTLELHAVGRMEDASGKIVKNMEESVLAWASGGCSQLLTSVQRKGKKKQVIFFESNGLRHREFLLPSTASISTTVIGLEWNVDSDMLAVTLREEFDNDNIDKVQLWHRSNYHWYMKQEFQYHGAKNNQVIKTKFDPEKPYKLCVILQNHEWREYEIRWDPSLLLKSATACTALVVDGNTLNATQLTHALIPPPMYMTSLELNCPIRSICVAPTSNSSVNSPISILVGLSDGTLALLSYNETSRQLQLVANVNIDLDDGIEPNQLRSFLIVASQGNNSVVAVAVACAPLNESCDRLYEFTISWNDDDIDRSASTSLNNSFTLEDCVLRATSWSDDNTGGFIELANGELLEYEFSENGSSVLPSEEGPMMEPCPWIVAMKDMSPFVKNEQDLKRSRLMFGLSVRSRLYCSDLLLADSVSSIDLSIAHQFFCYVTSGSRCELRSLPLMELYNFDPFMGSDQNIMLRGYEPRHVERGARLVAILPSKPSAVLQMPRGNLEGIFPRSLVLRDVMTKIMIGEYGNAFSMMRRQKVDLNLIVDMDPHEFLSKGTIPFVEQVTNIDYLNLFISSLQNWDVTQYRFPIPAWFWDSKTTDQPTARKKFDYSTKVNQVCGALRDIMITAESEKQTKGGKEITEGYFLLSILSTFAKESPPKLEEALDLIRTRCTKNNVSPPTSKKPPLFSDQAQNAIRYLAFLAEYELLFETALGMYDFDLARAVARNSQMDPKKYLPLLKRFRSLPFNYGKFEVDMRLKRYEAALKNLVMSNKDKEDLDGTLPNIQHDDEQKTASEQQHQQHAYGNSIDDCMNLIEAQNLHRTGLELFASDAPMRRKILISMAESLMKENRAELAVNLFMATSPPELDGALRAARACGDWRSFFALLRQQQLEDGSNVEDLEQLAQKIAQEVSMKANGGNQSDKRQAHSDAARILLDYTNDVAGAVDLLIHCEMWNEARRVATIHGRADLKQEVNDAALIFGQNALVEFEERTTQFETAITRYQESILIRKKAKVDEDPGLPDVDETGSLFSAASNASNLTLQSSTSMSSVTSTSSVSSVISVKSTTTFTMTGAEEDNRHRSKFGKGKKQKKPKKKKNSNKMQPGSEGEVQSLVTAIRAAVVGTDYAKCISETIYYLITEQQFELAGTMYNQYSTMKSTINDAQERRITTASQEKVRAEERARIEGDQMDERYLLLELPVEKDVDAMYCPALDPNVDEYFSLMGTGK